MKILLIYTGGTIGMVHESENNSYVPFDFENLQAQIPELQQLDCTLEVQSYEPSIDSSNMQPKIWLHLANTIEQAYLKYDGFVILHGSDTMAFTASALSFMLENLNKPVILTGSQLPSGVPRTDAKENLITAIEVASSTEMGFLKYLKWLFILNTNFIVATEPIKPTQDHFEAFVSANYPPLAEAGVHLKFNRRYCRKANEENLQVHSKMNANITVLKLFPGITKASVQAILNQDKTEAVLLETFGSGNAPTSKWFLDEIESAINKGLIILNVSQCIGGGVEMGRYETSKRLKDMGVLSAFDMSFEAALTKLMFVLGYTKSKEKRIALISTNLQGEMTL